MYCVGFRYVSREWVFLSADEVSFDEKIDKGTVMVRQRECVYTRRVRTRLRDGFFFYM